MYAVKYCGQFGFIKPYVSVRDQKVMSQRYLAPSAIEGMRQLLDVSKIYRYRLDCNAITWQQETTISKQTINKRTGLINSKKSIISRGILVNPVLHLLFENENDAMYASKQHVCLCRKQDILMPNKNIIELSELEFDNNIPRYELEFCQGKQQGAMSWGFNRFKNGEKMYGIMKIYGTPSDFEKI